MIDTERHFPLAPPWRLALVVDVPPDGSVLQEDEVDERPELVKALVVKRGLTAQLHPEDLGVLVRRSRVDEACSRLGLASDGTDPCAEGDVVVPVVLAKRSEDDVNPGFPDTAMVMAGCEVDPVGRLCAMYEALDQRVLAPTVLQVRSLTSRSASSRSSTSPRRPRDFHLRRSTRAVLRRFQEHAASTRASKENSRGPEVGLFSQGNRAVTREHWSYRSDATNERRHILVSPEAVLGRSGSHRCGRGAPRRQPGRWG